MTKPLFAACAVLLAFTSLASAQTPAASMDAGRFYGRADYLLWWTKDAPVPPPLVSALQPVGNDFRVGQTLLGGEDVSLGHHNGVRLTLGYWFRDDRVWGVETSGFYLPTVTSQQHVASSGRPGSVDIGVPFVDVNPASAGPAVSTISSSADGFSGDATLKLTSRLWGVEGNVVFALANPRPFRLELLGGFRYLNLREGLTLTSNSPDLPPGPVTVFHVHDAFDANNDFYGGQVGVRGRYEAGPFIADATLKLALGAMRQNVDVAGSFSTNFFTNGGTVQNFAGGIFALPTNIGSHHRDKFTVIPEVGINVGYRLTPWASVVLGYTFLYVSSVARPGNQIDTTLNSSQSASLTLNPQTALTGPARPAAKVEGSDFWAHGLNVGLAFSF